MFSDLIDSYSRACDLFGHPKTIVDGYLLLFFIAGHFAAIILVCEVFSLIFRRKSLMPAPPCSVDITPLLPKPRKNYKGKKL